MANSRKTATHLRGKVYTKDAPRIETMGSEEFRVRCAQDPLFFMESCLTIIPKEGGKLIPFRLNKEQMECLGKIWRVWKSGQPVRIILLKARQLGFSTFMEGFIYWMVSHRAHTSGLVLSHELPSVQHILQMSKRFSLYDRRRDRGIMPMMANFSKGELTFDNPDWRLRAANPGLDSRMKVAVAVSDSVGHSQTIQALHASEVSRWKDDSVLTGVYNAMANAAETFACLESTANGPYGVFYETWRAAEAGRNEWLPLFFSWKGRQEYRRTPSMSFEPDIAELALMKEHGLDLHEVCWRRFMIESPACQGQGRPPLDVFREQYPLTPDEAFVTTGRTYFDMGALLMQRSASKTVNFVDGVIQFSTGVIPPIKVDRDDPPRVKFVSQVHGDLRVWRPPEAGHDYTVGADVAAGVITGDYSTAYVFDRTTRTIVARFRAHIPPIQFAHFIITLGWYYNEAFVAPEANAIGIVVAREVAKHYRRTCYYVKLDQIGGGDSLLDPDRPGWYTTAANRKHMFAHMRQVMFDGTIRIYCRDFFEEATSFIIPTDASGRPKEAHPEAAARKHDDCIMAATIAVWVDDPMISGPIRKPKSKPGELPADWREAALRNDVKLERELAAPAPRYVDPHTGAEWD